MKGFSRFSSITVAPALFVVFAPVVGCIPNPDTSGLPPFDGGSSSSQDSTVPVTDGGGFDAIVPVDDSSPTEAAPTDSAAQVGTVNGVVIDYTQGGGSGVVPGATVSVSIPGSPSATVPASVTSDVNGVFTIANVPAGVPVQIGVSKGTDLTNGIAYSTTFLVTTVGAGQTVGVAPVLHEGCFQTFVVNPGLGVDAGNLPVTLQNATCQAPRTGAYAAMTFDATAFKDPVNGSLWAKGIRVEMIPLAYPIAAGGPDLGWAAGLPGATTPLGLLGAAEYRVVKSDPGQSDDGQLLAIGDNSVNVAIPVFAAPPAQAQPYSYSAATGAWAAETSLSTTFVPDGGTPVQYVTMQIPHLSWWAATTGAAPTTCITGTIVAGSNPLPNVLVRGVGGNYLGTSTGQTDSQGAFCLDLTGGGADAGAPQVQVATAALVGAVPYSGAKAVTVTTAPTASCKSASACAPIGQITLSPTLTCVSGSVVADGGAPPTKLNATIVGISVSSAASSAGIQTQAYVGQVSLGSGGSFCALAPPGTSLELQQPGNPNCWAPTTTTLQVLSGTAAPVCAAGGCSDAGAIAFGCGSGP